MTMYWKIIAPDVLVETTRQFIANLATNPSLEYDAAGWNTYGTSTLTRTTDYSRRGIYSLKVETSAASSGARFAIATTLTSGPYYEVSVDLLCNDGALALTMELLDGVSSLTTQTFTCGFGVWARNTYVYSGSLPTGSLTIRLYGASGQTFYVDGLQFVQRLTNTSTSYIDGDQDGCAWTGLLHASTSYRDVQYRMAGVEYDLQDQYGLRVRYQTGAGMAPMQHIAQDRAYLPGQEYQDYRFSTRMMMLTASVTGTSESNLRSKRRQLINVLSPATTRNAQEFLLAYSGGARKLYSCWRFNQGFDGSGQVRFFEAGAALGLRSDNPLWFEDNQQNAVLDVQDSATANYLMRRYQGQWTTVPSSGTTGTNGNVYALAFAPDGRLYIGGAHTTAGGTTVNRIHYWNGTANSTIGTGTPGLGGTVYAIAVAPSGLVYVGGAFTKLADAITTMQYVTLYTPGTNAFTALGSATAGTGTVYAIAINPINGNVVVGGNFTNWNGNASADYLAQWNGSAWSALSTGVNGIVYALAYDAQGNLYGAGAFTQDGSANNLRRVFKWDGSTFTELGSGGVTGGDVLALAIGPDGRVYAGGDATTWGGTSINRVAAWTGSAWESLGSGVNSTVQAIGFVSAQRFQNSGTVGNQLYIGGAFATADGVTLNTQYLTLWNAGRWVDTDIASSPTVYAIASDVAGNIYTGLGGTATVKYAGITAVTNRGSAPVNPTITIDCSTADTIFWIENQTTNQRLHLNLYVNAGERITINTRRGTITSIWKRVNLLNLLRSPGLTQFTLAPGRNVISAMTSAGTATVVLTWAPTYMSFDMD